MGSIAKPETTPRELYEMAQKHRAHAHALEREAIERALEASGGLVKPAALAIGMPHATLVSRLAAAHADLGEKALQLRKACGYTRGNPTRRKR